MGKKENKLTCTKCGYIFDEPLTRILPFTQTQYEKVIQTYGKDFQICPKCNNIFNPNAKSNQGCYIATAIYGDQNHPSVCVLREYRDNNLSKSLYGRLFVKLYYSISPLLVEFIKENKLLNKHIKKILDKIVHTISNK